MPTPVSATTSTNCDSPLFDTQSDSAACRREFQGVEEQVQNGFFQLVAVHQQRAQSRLHERFQLQSLVHRPFAGRRWPSPLHEGAHFHWFALDFHAAGFQPDQVEQIVDQLEQAHAVGVHDGQQIARGGVKLWERL